MQRLMPTISPLRIPIEHQSQNCVEVSKLTNLIKSLKGVVQEVGLTALDLVVGGEWISYLQENGFDAQGVDSSPIMVKQCQSMG